MTPKTAEVTEQAHADPPGGPVLDEEVVQLRADLVRVTEELAAERAPLIGERRGERGWVELGRADHRRGIWMRVRPGFLEVCAGREGDDNFVSVAVTPEQEVEARGCLSSFTWAAETAAVENRSRAMTAEKVSK